MDDAYVDLLQTTRYRQLVIAKCCSERCVVRKNLKKKSINIIFTIKNQQKQRAPEYPFNDRCGASCEAYRMGGAFLMKVYVAEHSSQNVGFANYNLSIGNS